MASTIFPIGEERKEQSVAQLLLEAKLSDLAVLTKQETATLRQTLSQSGLIGVDSNATLLSIAKQNNKDAPELLELILGEE